MKKQILTLLSISLSGVTFAQVGINNTTPSSTLDVTAKTATGNSVTTNEGLLIPRVDRARVLSMASPVTSTMIYVNDISTGTATGTAVNVDAVGFYFYNGVAWVKMGAGSGAAVTANNGLTLTASNIQLGGALMQATTVSGLTAANTLAFTGTGVNAFSVDGSTLSVDAANHLVGFGTSTPGARIDILGTGGADDNIMSTSNGNNASSDGSLIFRRSRNTAASPASVASLDNLGSMAFWGHDGTAYRQVARIGSIVNGTVATNSVPTDLFFSTGVTSPPSEKMRITSAGNVGIGTSAPGNNLHIIPDGSTSGMTTMNAKGIAISSNSLAPGIYLEHSGASSGSRVFYMSSYNGLFGIYPLTDNAGATVPFITSPPSIGIKSPTGNVGILNNNPSATLDILARNATGTSTAVDGIVIPRVDRQRAGSMTGVATSTMVYINSVATGTQTGTTANVDAVGFYYFDGSAWAKISNTDTSIYKGSGSLSGNTTVTQAGNTLAFTGTANNAFSVDGSTLSVDAANHRVGIGTTAPSARLNIVGLSGVDDDFNLTSFDPSGAASISIQKSAGTPAAPAAVSWGATLGYISFSGNDGNYYPTGASVRSYVDGTVASNTIPSNLTFYTGSNFSNQGERMRISSSGNIGVATYNPAATLDINAKSASGNSSDVDGLIIPRVTRERAGSMVSIPTSTLIYVNDISSGALSGTTVNVDAVGFYYYNGTAWVKMSTGSGAAVTASNGLTLNANNLQLGGALTQATTVSGLTAANTLAFTGTGVNAFSVDDSTLSVDAANHRLGLGTTTPNSRLQIAGTGGGDDTLNITSNGSTGNGDLIFTKSQGTLAAPAINNNFDVLGQVMFQGYDGTAYLNRARMMAQVVGTVSSGVVPTDLVFFTGSSSMNARMRINAAGNIGVSTFPTVTMDIAAKTPTGTNTDVDGLMIPRVDRQRAQSMTSVPTSTLLYINSVANGTQTGTTANVDASGFYYYDGSVWQKVGGAAQYQNSMGTTNTLSSSTTSYTVTASDYLIITTAAAGVTLTLPTGSAATAAGFTSANAGKTIYLFNYNNNSVSGVANTINGLTAGNISWNQGRGIPIIWTGSMWISPAR